MIARRLRDLSFLNRGGAHRLLNVSASKGDKKDQTVGIIQEGGLMDFVKFSIRIRILCMIRRFFLEGKRAEKMLVSVAIKATMDNKSFYSMSTISQPLMAVCMKLALRQRIPSV